MVERPDMQNRIFPMPRPVTGPETRPTRPQPGQQPGQFAALLERELSSLKFSRHAEQRMQTRQIELDTVDLAKLQEAVDKAAQKGARDSLILTQKGAFIVNVKSRTVVTAVDSLNLKENVFTNIDSAVIVD